MIPVSDGLRRGAIRGNRAGVRGLVLASFSLALLVFMARRHSDTRERSFLLVEENARGKNIDPLLQPLQEARRSEQNAVAQLRAAVLKAEGLTKNDLVPHGMASEFLAGQRLLAEQLAPPPPARVSAGPGAILGHDAFLVKFAALERQKAAARKLLPTQQKDVASPALLKPIAVASPAADPAAFVTVDSAANGSVDGDSVGATSLPSRSPKKRAETSKKNAPANGSVDRDNVGATTLQSRSPKKRADTRERNAPANGSADGVTVTFPASVAKGSVTISFAGDREGVVPASYDAAAQQQVHHQPQQPQQQEHTEQQSPLASLQQMAAMQQNMAAIAATMDSASRLIREEEATAPQSRKILPVQSIGSTSVPESRSHLADVELGEDIARLSKDVEGVRAKSPFALQMLGMGADAAETCPEGQVLVDGICSFAGTKSDGTDGTSDALGSDAVKPLLGPDGKPLFDPKELAAKRAKENGILGKLLPGFDPSALSFHKDVADMVKAGDILMPRQKMKEGTPDALKPFLGEGEKQIQPGPFEWGKLTPADKEEFKKRQNLNFGNPEEMWQRKYPLTPKAKGILFGSSYPYQRNKYGALADVIPSSRQYHRQIGFPFDQPWRHAHPYRHYMKNKWPKHWPLYQYRWRRNCHKTSTAEGASVMKDGRPNRSCPWKWHLEPRVKKCEWPLCTLRKRDHWAHQPQDPIEKQVLSGALNGHADPLGVGELLDDEPMKAEDAELIKKVGGGMAANEGEPVGDFMVRGWNVVPGKNDYKGKVEDEEDR